MRPHKNAPLLGVAAAVAVAGLYATQRWSVPVSSSSSAGNSPASAPGGAHADVAPHSVNVMPAGDYHVEAQVRPSGDVELYIYGLKERQLFAIPIRNLDLEMDVQAVVAGEPNAEVAMTPRPYALDPPGMSSRFVGRFSRTPDQQAVGLSVTLPLDGRMCRLQWRPEQLTNRAAPVGDPMPGAVSSTEADKLFLTPGGAYTDADIAANGRVTATQKYGSQRSAHNPHPRPGERVCPITDTLANSKFTWIIGGKTYTFCCPPCIEEFVKRAKEKPETLRDPKSYVKSS